MIDNIIKIQTMKNNSDNSNYPYFYNNPSKIWKIKKNKLNHIPFFFNLFKYNSDKIKYLLESISDVEMKLLLDYIDKKYSDFSKIHINDLMLLIKISDFTLYNELFNRSYQEFYNRFT